MIDPGESPSTGPASRLRTMLTAPAPTSLVLLLVAVVATGMYMSSRPTAVPTVSVLVGVSDYPAAATASWRDTVRISHDIDPWGGQAQQMPARSVTLVVTTAGVQCTLAVDGRTVDTQIATATVPAVCTWVAP